MAEQTGQRLDKWLWFARIAKTRTLGAQLVTGGKVRVNREKVSKPSRIVQQDDVITAAVHGRIRVLRILLPGERRGPASEAQALYEDLSPPPVRRPWTPAPTPPARRPRGAGRPTKRDRRRIDAWTANRVSDLD